MIETVLEILLTIIVNCFILNDMKTAFTVQDAAQLTGAEKRNIRYWVGIKVLKAEVQDAQVQRTPKLFSLKNVFQIGTVELLSEWAVPHDLLRNIMEKAEIWSPGIEGTEMLVLKWPGMWKYQFSPEPLSKERLPLMLSVFLASLIAQSEDILVVNLSNIKRRILAQL